MEINDLTTILEAAPKNLVIQDSFTKAAAVLSKHERPVCSVSGGADSDVVVDILTRLDKEKKITYVFFHTGIEFRATLDHLDWLEKTYDITIKREHPKKGIPLACKEYGQPFLSKRVSEYMYRLQKHNFDFANGDRPFEELIEEYPNCHSALSWWCNCNDVLNISRNAYLKEFILAHPPTFRISAKCCEHAKKAVAHRVIKEGEYDLDITGIRGAEGFGRRASYKGCYSVKSTKHPDTYRPIFWYSGTDKKEYEEFYKLRHSDCYERYGMVRTGCVGCPYALGLETELEILETYEPNLYKVANLVFADSYAYTRSYREFRDKKKKAKDGQMSLYDFM